MRNYAIYYLGVIFEMRLLYIYKNNEHRKVYRSLWLYFEHLLRSPTPAFATPCHVAFRHTRDGTCVI